MMKSWLTKARQLITYPFRMIYDFYKFNMELDREIAKNRYERDEWVDRKMAAEQNGAPTNHIGETERFETFVCEHEKLVDWLEFYQSQKKTLGFQKVKVDSMVPHGKTKVFVVVRFFSPAPRDAT
jgi:G3E family GTPase